MASDRLAHLAKNVNIHLTPKDFCKSFMNKRKQERERRETEAEKGRETEKETKRDRKAEGENVSTDLGRCLRSQEQTKWSCF